MCDGINKIIAPRYFGGKTVPVMDNGIIPEFETAVEQFQDFLKRNNGLAAEILWVFREDVTWRKDRIYIRQPLNPENPARARDLYEIGRSRGNGLRLETLCIRDSHPYCYVWVPAGPREAEERNLLMSPFIMAIREKLGIAIPVRSFLKWKLLKRFENPRTAVDKDILDSLPLRSGSK
jgi:hypothetical protein